MQVALRNNPRCVLHTAPSKVDTKNKVSFSKYFLSGSDMLDYLMELPEEAKPKSILVFGHKVFGEYQSLEKSSWDEEWGWRCFRSNEEEYLFYFLQECGEILLDYAAELEIELPESFNLEMRMEKRA